MEDSKRWALQLNHKSLVRDLQVEDIQDHLITFGVMDEDDMEKILSEKSRKDRAAAFMAKLKRRGPNAFSCFVDALREKQPYLSEKLQNDAKMMAKRIGRGAIIEVDAITLQTILQENDSLHKLENENQQLQAQTEELQKKNDWLSDRLHRERKRSAELSEESDTMKSKHDESVQSINTLLTVVSEKKRQADQVEQDREELEAHLYRLEEMLNLKAETIKRLENDKRKVEGNVIQEHRMVCNLKGQLEAVKKDMEIMKDDMRRVREERNVERRCADERGHIIQKLQHELMKSRQLKNNCDTIISHLNHILQSKEQQAQQSQADLCGLLNKYLDLKETVS